MELREREALKSLRLSWAPNADALWHSEGAFHVSGVHDDALGQVLDAYADARRDDRSSPLGVVVRGPAGSGKTHLLGHVRERVQADGGFFFLLELLDATSFWESTRSGILESLGRPAINRETQLKELLWQLASIAHVSRIDRKAIVGDDPLTPEVLSRFINSLNEVNREVVRQTHHTLRALVLYGAADFAVQDVGQAYLTSTEDVDDTGRRTWSIGVSTLTPQECVRQISRIVALAGPAVLAVDQIDTLLAQSSTRIDAVDAAETMDNRDLEHVAHGLMSIRQDMRRTAAVVACLPAVWELIRSRAVATVSDRFRTTAVLQGLPSADVGRAILERRFTASYRSIEFTPPYPSWPIKVSAFVDAPDYTPRGLLKRADVHVRSCLDRDVAEELGQLTAATRPEPETQQDSREADLPLDAGDLDRRFAGYRQRSVGTAALDPEGEDTTVPELLSAALEAWIAECGDTKQSFRLDPPQGKRLRLHARLRQSLDAATDDERHWAFRAIATAHAGAAQTRIKNACVATGFGVETNLDRRKLFLLRNVPWPSGVKTAELVAEFEAAGGRTLLLSADDLATMSALRDLIADNHPDLAGWLVARKPAHGLRFLRTALGEQAGPPPPEPPALTAAPDAHPAHPRAEPVALSPTVVPLGTDDTSGQSLGVDLLALRKHTAIFAGSGSGKTVLIRRLVEECALRGVSSIVLDPNNDLARLGLAWPTPPPGWDLADTARAADYLDHTEVVVWTPGRSAGRPLSFQPLPDFAGVVDDPDEYDVAVESAFAALEPRALIIGNTPKANQRRAVLREALWWYGRQPATTNLAGFLDVLADLPDRVSGIGGAREYAAELGQNLRASKVNDRMFGGDGTPADPGTLLTPSSGYRARVSVISMVGLQNDAAREGFVNQLQMALFAWIKRNPAGDRPLGGLLVMDEAQNFAPSGRITAATQSTLALSSQARKYGLGLIFATQMPRGLHNHIPGNAATQFYGLLNSSTQITVAKEIARVKGGYVPDISRLRAGNFYAALEGRAFQRISTPWCLSQHPHSPLTTEEVLELARLPLAPRSAG